MKRGEAGFTSDLFVRKCHMVHCRFERCKAGVADRRYEAGAEQERYEVAKRPHNILVHAVIS